MENVGALDWDTSSFVVFQFEKNSFVCELGLACPACPNDLGRHARTSNINHSDVQVAGMRL